MKLDSELVNIEESQIKTTKWIKYFISEISQIKKQLEEVKKREDILGKSVLKLYGIEDSNSSELESKVDASESGIGDKSEANPEINSEANPEKQSS